MPLRVAKALGPLILVSLALAVGVSLATLWSPNVLLYDWIGPLRILRDVAFRAWFPSAVGLACVFGALVSNKQRGAARPRQNTLHETWRSPPNRLGAACRSRDTWGALLAALSLTLAASVVAPDYTLVDLLCVFVAVAWLAARGVSWASARAALVDTGRAALLFVAVSYVFTLVKAHLFVASTPRDAAILGFERAVFGTPIHHRIVQWVNAVPASVGVLDEVYFMLFEHMAVASVFLSMASLRRERGKLWSALAICYLVGGPAYYLLPALGPAFYEPGLYEAVASRGALSHEMWQALLYNTEAFADGRPLIVVPYSFIACMPSLHIAHEAVMLWYARYSKPFFAVSLVFTLLSSVAVMALGWHYFVDLFGGLALAALALFVVERFGSGIPVSRDTAAVESRPWRLASLALIVAPALLFARALAYPLVVQDSSRLERPLLYKTLKGLQDIWTYAEHNLTYPVGASRSYEPVAASVEWLSALVLGSNARAHHLLNMTLLGLIAWTLFELCVARGIRRSLAALSTVLFMVHPVSAVAAGYVSGRCWLIGLALWLVGALWLSRDSRRSAGAVMAAVSAFLLTLVHPAFSLASLAWIPLLPRSSRSGRSVSAVAGLVLGWVCAEALRGVIAPSLVPATAGAFVMLLPDVIKTELGALSVCGSGGLAYTALPGSGMLGACVAVGLVLIVVLAMLRAPRAVAWDQSLCRSGLVLAATAPLTSALAGVSGAGQSDLDALPMLMGLLLCSASLADAISARGLAHARVFRLSSYAAWGLVLALLPAAWAELMVLASSSAVAENLLIRHPNDPRANLFAGAAAIEQGEFESALSQCSKAEQRGIPARQASVCIALSQYYLGDARGALSRLDGVSPARESSPAFRKLYLTVLLADGQTDRALARARDWNQRFTLDVAVHRTIETSGQRSEPTLGAEAVSPKAASPPVRAGHFATGELR